MNDRAQEKQFTGRHMMAIMAAFFGVIIAVNVTMAVVARTSWSGFVVRNSYVASQEFNDRVAEGRAQAALGWTTSLSIEEGRVRLAVLDGAGRAVPADAATIVFRRPIGDADDRRVELVAAEAGFEGEAALGDGLWIAEIEVAAGLDHPYRDLRRFPVAGGSMR